MCSSWIHFQLYFPLGCRQKSFHTVRIFFSSTNLKPFFPILIFLNRFEICSRLRFIRAFLIIFWNFQFQFSHYFAKKIPTLFGYHFFLHICIISQVFFAATALSFINSFDFNLSLVPVVFLHLVRFVFYLVLDPQEVPLYPSRFRQVVK